MIEELSHHALERLRSAAARWGVACEEDAGELVLASHRVALSVANLGLHPQGQQVLAALEIQLHVDGAWGERFRVGTLGVGRQASQAQQAAIDEWFQLAGEAVLAALVGRPAAAQWGAWRCWPGRAGFRGQVPGAMRPGGTLAGGILAHLAAEISAWPASPARAWRSAAVVASWGEGNFELQAAVDGELEEAWIAQMARLHWPRGADPWSFKQFFVLSGVAPA